MGAHLSVQCTALLISPCLIQSLTIGQATHQAGLNQAMQKAYCHSSEGYTCSGYMRPFAISITTNGQMHIRYDSEMTPGFRLGI